MVATYNGDVNDAPASGECGDPREEVVLSPMADCTQPVAGSSWGDAPSLTEGDAASGGGAGNDYLVGGAAMTA